MPDREDDEDRRPAGAVFPGGAGEAGRAIGADAGHAGAKALGDPSAKGLGDPGGAKGLGDPSAKGLGNPGGAKGLGNPGGAKGLGNPGGAKGLGNPGGAKGLGNPGGGKGLGNPGSAQPGYGPPGYAPPGYGQPGYAPPGYSQPGFTPPSYAPQGFTPPGFTQPGSALSIKAVLASIAAIVAVIVAAIAAFFVLRPDPPRQTAQEPPVGTIDTPSGGGATPGIATSSEPLFRGTYSSRVTVTSVAGTSTNENVGTVVSDCPHCDVTLSGGGPATVFHWNGNVWEHLTEGPTCAGDSVTFTPTVVADGFVQELDYHYATCNGTVSTGTMTRIGD